MKLSDLEALEAEYTKRGWRVVVMVGSTAEEELTKDDGTGWATREEAGAIAARLDTVAGRAYRPIQVTGPDGAAEIWYDTGTHGPAPIPEVPSGIEPEPTPEPQSELPVLDAIPAGGPLTVLTCNDEHALVGDGEGQVYVCPRAALEGRDQVRWRPRTTSFEALILSAPDGRGSEQMAHFQDVRSADGALTARVAYHRPSLGEPGLWRVKRAA